MSHSVKPISQLRFDALTDRFRSSLSLDDCNKPDLRELDLGSPVSPLPTRPRGPACTWLATTGSSSSSSGSVSGRNGPNAAAKRYHSGCNNWSGEPSASLESSPMSSESVRSPGGSKPGHVRWDSGGSAMNSPAVNVFPTGNICPSGKILKTGMASQSSKTDVLGSGTGNYGHGSIMRGGCAAKSGAGQEGGADVAKSSGFAGGRAVSSMDAEVLKRAGNEQYKMGHLSEALRLYNQAVAISPTNATYRFNRAVTLTGLKLMAEAVMEFEEAIKLDPGYWKAHHRLGSLLLRLGQVENARRHLCFLGHQLDSHELFKLKAVEMHLSKCCDARKIGDWKGTLREADATIAAGADESPQLQTCKAEAFLKLHQLEDAATSLSNVPKFERSATSGSQAKFFGMICEAYLFFVQAQIEIAMGRCENAVTAAEKAWQIDPQNAEVSLVYNNVKLATRARACGNSLFKSERYTEACAAYGEGLRLCPSSSVLYCNRAACWYKLGLWEQSVDDCSQALRIQPNYTKALLRKAASNSKLEYWAEAVRDYKILRRELPDDNEVAESLFHAQLALKKSRGEEVYNMKFGGEVESVSGLKQFRAAINSPGASVVHFMAVSNIQCRNISPFLDTLCHRYPSINFLKVDVEENPAVADAETVRIVPTFKIYKNGSRVKELVCPSPEVLESSARHYSL